MQILSYLKPLDHLLEKEIKSFSFFLSRLYIRN